MPFILSNMGLLANILGVTIYIFQPDAASRSDISSIPEPLYPPGKSGKLDVRKSSLFLGILVFLKPLLEQPILPLHLKELFP